MTPGLPRRIAPVRLLASTVTTAAGDGLAALSQALQHGQTALRPASDPLVQAMLAGRGEPGMVGLVEGLDAPLPAPWQAWDCRNNRLAWRALQADGFLDVARQAVAHHGAARVAVLMGTSTSSIGASEAAYARLTPDGAFPPDLARPEVHALHSLGGFVAQAIGAAGPCMTVATACSSSAKVFAQAERLLHLGLVDAVVVGGVDSLCRSIWYGFRALGLVSGQACRPFDVARDGISLAEAGGYALLVRATPTLAPQQAPAWQQALHHAPAIDLIGHGESSDAHHMSGPHPQGLGARQAMGEALARAGLLSDQVDYINLHGTATPLNDAVEAGVVGELFSPATRVSSTKGWTGHTLGAAGIVEALVCVLALREGRLPGSLGTHTVDPAMGARFAAMLQHDTVQRPCHVAMSNSFGFGGNNCSLVFARADGARADRLQAGGPAP